MVKYIPVGDSALCIRVGDEFSEEGAEMVRQLLLAVEDNNYSYVTDLLPSYNELTVFFNPAEINYKELVQRLRALNISGSGNVKHRARSFEVPVCYGGNLGPDLPLVAEAKKMSEEWVVDLHSKAKYTIAAMGFTPGFCYLSGLDKKLSMPRMSRPRKAVAAGAVGITSDQSGIYPVSSPGGWRWIGTTPLRLFSAGAANPFLFSTGDQIVFKGIEKQEFDEIKEAVEAGNFIVNYCKTESPE